MNRILLKKELAPGIKLIEVEVPVIAERTRAGQFVVLRVDETGERIPLTIADWDRGRGALTVIFQEVGVTTMKLGRLQEGDEILDLVGPLGRPTDVQNFGTIVCVGGGIGIAPVYPIAREMGRAGNNVISIIGARSKDLLILKEEMRGVSDELYITTDDGSYGRHGFVSDELQRLIDEGRRIDLVLAIGPPIMMKVISEVTRLHSIRTVVSLDSIMVDATGMCGGCRVMIGGQTKFVCVDGPEFDGHQVDFDQLMARKRMYLSEERMALERYQRCSRSEGACTRRRSHWEKQEERQYQGSRCPGKILRSELETSMR